MAETRITSGAWRGRAVDTPRGERTMRPTSSLVRKALFDILGNIIEGAAFVDVFAGTGAVGLEALSRGARRVTAVEKDRALCRLISGSADRLGATSLRVVPADAVAWLRSRPADISGADVIFLDAPYKDDVLLTALEVLGADAPPSRDASPAQIVVCEHHRARRLPEIVGSLLRRREAHYGTSQLTFYKRQDDSSEAPPVGQDRMLNAAAGPQT